MDVQGVVMKATFDMGDMQIEVEADHHRQGVHLRVITDVDRERGIKHVERELTFSKSVTRAIASTMMGCAAEL
jgi:hypothetical protein